MYNNITIIPYYIIVKRGDTRAVHGRYASRSLARSKGEHGNENDAVSLKIIRRVYNMFFFSLGLCMKDRRFFKRQIIFGILIDGPTHISPRNQ